MDELVDNGMILEADPAVLVSRVALRTDDIPLGEQTVAQVPVPSYQCSEVPVP